MVRVAKADIPDPRSAGARKSIGLPRAGRIAGWRFPPDERCGGLHVHDDGTHWLAHRDEVHPRCGLLAHFRRDVIGTRPGGVLEDAGAALGKAIDDAGKAVGSGLCHATPVEARRGLVDLVRKNEALFANPFFGWLVSGWPRFVLDVAETCDVTESGRRTCCDLARNSEIILALAPIAGSLATISVVGAPALPILGIMAGFAATAGPLFRAGCARRAPNIGDLVAMVDALTRASVALASGNITGSMDAVTAIATEAAKSRNPDPVKAILEADRRITAATKTYDRGAFARAKAKESARATARERARLLARLAAHKQAADVAAAAASTTTTTPKRSSGGGGLALAAAAAAIAAFATR